MIVLVGDEIDELTEPLLGVLDEQPARVAELGVVWIEDVSGEEGPQVDDELLV